MRVRAGDRVPVLVGCLATATAGIAMWRSPSPWTFTHDTGSVFLGQTVPAFRTWFSGGVPEWSDVLWGGFPLIGDCTSAALYPLHALAYLTTLTAPLRFFDVAFALHLGIFAAGSATLVRRLGASAGATALGGLLAALSPWGHCSAIVAFPVFGAHAWWPWAFVAAESLSRPATPLVGGAMALGWIALAAQVLAGVPEQASYCALAVTAWLLVRRTGLRPADRVLRLAILGAGAAALAAPQLLPTMLLVEWTHRAQAPANYAFGSLWLSDPVRLFVAGTGVLNGQPSFLGAVTLVLALVAVGGRRPGAVPLLAVAVVAFALALGPQVGLYELLHRVPPFSYYRNPAKIYGLAEYATLWLAALGADTLLRNPSRAARLAGVLCIAGTLAERAIYLVQEVEVLQAMRAGDGLTPRRYARLAELTELQRPPAGPPPTVYDAGGPAGGEYARSVGALLGISSIHAGTVALLSGAHLDLLQSPSVAAMDVFGVRYVLAPAGECPALEPRIPWPASRSDEDCVWRNPKAPGRYAFVADVRPVDSRETMIALARAEPRPVPVVAAPEVAHGLGDGAASVTAYAPGHVELLTAVPARGLLLVRESFAPGWHVSVDGRPVEPHPMAGIFFGVPVDRGVHRIVLDYRAPGLRAGAGVAVAWVLLASLAAWRRRRSRGPGVAA